jgi:adenylosuccinate synthase
MTHIIVTDLGFGDSGKGSVTDWLCSPHGTALRGERPAAAVVRYNGGAQAGHNVTDGRRHHTFSQFGSGTFHRTPTFLSRFMMIDPLALAAEDAHLEEAGLGGALDLMTIDRDALITTPYHVAANRARERARGAGRHGSCGKGIGETARFALEHPDAAVRARDCAGPAVQLRRKLTWTRLLLTEEAGPLGDVPPVSGLAAAYEAFASRVALTDGRAHLARLLKSGPVIFEGAQGVLLDEQFGFHPYTTWSATTSANAETLLAEAGEGGFRLGVTRSYMTRHGAGPFVTEDPALSFGEPHNTTDEWQGAFRAGHPDAMALAYAAEVNGGIDGLAVTHLDQASRYQLRLCTGYTGPYGSRITKISPDPGPHRSLAWQAQLTNVLAGCTPAYDDARPGPEDWPDILGGIAGVPVVLRSHGPGAGAKTAVVPAGAAG